LSSVDLLPKIGEIRRGRDIGKSVSQHPAFFRYQVCVSCGKEWWARENANVKKCRNCCCKKERLYSTKDPVVGEIRYGEEIGKFNEHNTKFIYVECSWCGVKWWTDIYRIPTKCHRCCQKKPRKRDCSKPQAGDVRWGDEIGEGFSSNLRYEYRECEDCGVLWWAGLKNPAPKCFKKCFMCVHKEQRKEKACTMCKNVYPTTDEYFHHSVDTTLGISSLCIQCYKKVAKERYRKKRELFGEKLRSSISSSIKDSLKGKKNGRRWETLVGYTLKNLMKHLEKQFVSGMNWENYGKWHVDHIIPQSVFGYVDINDLDFGRCWALTNLRPMWWRDNVSKRDKIIKPFQPSLDVILYKGSIKNKVDMTIKDLSSVYRCDIVN
jgi:hypothetical protein